MELTTEQRIEIKKFAIDAAIKIMSMSPGRIIKMDIAEVPDNFNIQEFENLFKGHTQYFRPEEHKIEFISPIDQIKEDAQKIFDWIIGIPKTGREEY